MRHLSLAARAIVLVALFGATSVRAAEPKTETALAALKAQTAAMLKGIAPLPKPTSTDGESSSLDAPPVIWRVKSAITEVQDSPVAPILVVIPAGEYTMGTPVSDQALFETRTIHQGRADKFTRHRVRIAAPFGFSKFPVTVGQFAQFVKETGYDPGNVCQVSEDGLKEGFSWKNPNYTPATNQPVVCVNYADSMAYVGWLSKKTGHTYRLPSDAEYEYVNRAGTTTAYWWGDEIGSGHSACITCGTPWDGKAAPPVGSFPPNPFGVYDTTGTVWSRTRDCWNDNFENAPSDGSANLGGNCEERVFRGGGYRTAARNLRVAIRHESSHANRFNDDGFHVVRTF